MAKKKRVKSKKPKSRTRASKSERAPLPEPMVLNPLEVTITFTRGDGEATVTLFRNGLQTGQVKLTVSGKAKFPDTQSGDSIAINGTCTGNAKVEISVSTDPATPESFGTGSFNRGYDVL